MAFTQGWSKPCGVIWTHVGHSPYIARQLIPTGGCKMNVHLPGAGLLCLIPAAAPERARSNLPANIPGTW